MSTARQERIRRFFAAYDTDSDGQISGEDFRLQARRRIDAARLDPASEKARHLEEQYRRLWEGLCKQCDADADGKVTLVEWEAVWTLTARRATTFAELPAWFRAPFERLCNALFPRGGRLSLEDVRRILEASGRGGEVEEVRRNLFGDEDTLSRAKLEAHWFRFLCSEEPDVPNVLFGA